MQPSQRYSPSHRRERESTSDQATSPRVPKSFRVAREGWQGIPGSAGLHPAPHHHPPRPPTPPTPLTLHPPLAEESSELSTNHQSWAGCLDNSPDAEIKVNIFPSFASTTSPQSIRACTLLLPLVTHLQPRTVYT